MKTKNPEQRSLIRYRFRGWCSCRFILPFSHMTLAMKNRRCLSGTAVLRYSCSMLFWTKGSLCYSNDRAFSLKTLQGAGRNDRI